MGVIVKNTYDAIPVVIAPGEEQTFTIHGSNNLEIKEGPVPVAETAADQQEAAVPDDPESAETETTG